MALIKTQEEIEIMREGGAILSHALQKAVDAVRPGVLMSEIDKIAEQALLDQGAKPSFKDYKGGGDIAFPSTLCISANDEIVHGCGDRDIELKEGDIVGLDIGCWYKDLCTDMAVTVPVGSISEDRKKLLRRTRLALDRAVEQCREGNMIQDIAKVVEEVVGGEYGIVESLTGHGVGHAVHEKPSIPNFTSSQFPVVRIKQGMCLALEPMLTVGDKSIETDDDGWSIRTQDRSDAAHFEVTLVVTEDGPEILTPHINVNI